MRKLSILVSFFLGACVPIGPSDTASRALFVDSALPPMKTFGETRVQPTRRSNNDIALDFIELSFNLESGRSLPVFTRFEGPISLRVTGTPPNSLDDDLEKLLSRLRNEAGIRISRVNADRPANITVQAIPRADIRRALPQAACFVVPNITDISEYRSARKQARTNWSTLRIRQQMAIFLPNDASPQEVRDCLHEELAQALGPLNDLYRLPDSVFNDDNVHAVLTGFDMLILRAYYDPALRSGMTRGEVARRLPSILDRIHPQGAGRPSQFAARTPLAWSQAIQTALGPGASNTARRSAALEAVRLARAKGWTDHRRAFAHYAAGRVLIGSDSDAAYAHFLQADQFYASTPNAELHRAYVATQLAARAVSLGEAQMALDLIGPYLDRAADNENAALLSTLLLLRAEALDLAGRPAEASNVRLDSLGWARYGYGPDWAVRAKLREISALNPMNG